MKAKCTKKPAKEPSKAVVTPRAKPPQTKPEMPLKGAIATPGDSAKKEKKKKVATLDSFFGKGKKKKDVATKPLLKVGCKPSKTEGSTENKDAANDKKEEKSVKTNAKGDKISAESSTKNDRKTANKRKPSVLESVGADETSISKDQKETTEDVLQLEASKSEKAAVVDSKIDLIETKDVVMKGISSSEPDDDDTVEIDEDKIPPPSCDSCSEASEVEPIEEVAIGAAEVESPLSKSSEEEPKDAVMRDSLKQADLFAGVPCKSVKKAEVTDEKQSMSVDAELDQSMNREERVSNEEPIDTDMEDATESADFSANVPLKSVKVVKSIDKMERSPSTDATLDQSKNGNKGASKAKPRKASKSTGSSSKKETPKKSTAAKCASTKTATVKVEPEPVPLSEENAARMKKYTDLRQQYVARAVELANRSTSDEFARESLSDEELAVLDSGSIEVAEDGGFPDELLPRLLLLVQGRYEILLSITTVVLFTFF